MTEGEYGSHKTIGNIGKQNGEQFLQLSLIDFESDYASGFVFSIVKIITSVVTSNCNNHSSQLYYVCNPCKMTKWRYRSHETIDDIGK